MKPQFISRTPPTDAAIAELLRRLPLVRDAVRSGARPIVVEFAGLPRSGKSTCIATIKHFLRRNQMSVFSPFEGASITPEFLKSQLLDYNIWAACYALTTMLEGVYVRQPDKYDVVLLDRGLFDAICWITFLKSREKSLTKREFQSITRFLRVGHWKNNIDLVCLFTCDPRESSRREHAGMLTRQSGVATGVPFLRSLLENYEQCAGCYSGDFRKFLWFRSTKNSNNRAVAYATLKALFDLVEQQRM